MHNTAQWLDHVFILMNNTEKSSENYDVDVLSSHGSQSPLQINAYAYIFLMLVQLCFLNRKNEISPTKKPLSPY